jgi:transcription elongation factor Elf1
VENKEGSCMNCSSKNITVSWLEKENKVHMKCNDCGFELKYQLHDGIIDLEFDSERFDGNARL